MVNIIKNSVQSLHDREVSRRNSNYLYNENATSFIEVNSASDLSSEDKSATSTPTRILDDNYSMLENNRRNENLQQKDDKGGPDRPLSQMSMAKSTDANKDEVDIGESSSRPKTANTLSGKSRSSSIHELMDSRAQSAVSSRGGDDHEQQVVTDYDIDEEPGLENEARGKGLKLEENLLEIEQEELTQAGDSDVVDGAQEQPDEDAFLGDLESHGESDHADNKNRTKRRDEDEAELVEFEETERRNESDSGSLTSTEESSDQISQSNETLDKEPSLDEEQAIKPLPVMKRKRPPMLLRKNRVSDVKATTIPTVSTHKNKPQDLFATKTLRRFEKPREALNTCLNQLDSTIWEQTMTGLQSFVRLIRFHPELVETNIHPLSVALCKHVKNLRSQVSRSACEACGEFFATHSKYLEPEIDDMAITLLNRTADTNKFLRADASKALNAMCDHMPANKIIQAIVTRGATHPNAIVRTASANLLNRVVGRLGCDKLFAMSRECREKLILAAANLMMEGSLETRNHAKMLFKQLSPHPLYHKTILEVIPPRTYRNIEKSLKAIK